MVGLCTIHHTSRISSIFSLFLFVARYLYQRRRFLFFNYTKQHKSVFYNNLREDFFAFLISMSTTTNLINIFHISFAFHIKDDCFFFVLIVGACSSYGTLGWDAPTMDNVNGIEKAFSWCLLLTYVSGGKNDFFLTW